MQSIPKIIHYCWFGGKPLPPLAIRCIESWRKYLPEYEVKEWNESNFDVNIIPYTEEAYKVKKYAFVSDYARFWILYKYGGLYFDTDVEIIRPLDDIIIKGAFMGCESAAKIGISVPHVNPGLGLGCVSGHLFYKNILDLYASLHFINSDNTYNLKTIVDYTTELLVECGLKSIHDIQTVCDIFIYPVEYFCPVSIDDGKMRIGQKTRTIHHYAQSWRPAWRIRARKVILSLGGTRLKGIIKKLLHI